MTSKFESMTDAELRQYFLRHRDDESFHAYMDRRQARPKRVILSEEEAKLPIDDQMKLVEERLRSRSRGAPEFNDQPEP